MTETIKNIDRYIKESEAILNKGNDLLIKAQIVKIKCELGFDDNLDNEYSMLSMCSGHSLNHKDRQILISLINRMKNYRVKLIDERRIVFISPIIGIVGVVIGAILTFALNWLPKLVF